MSDPDNGFDSGMALIRMWSDLGARMMQSATSLPLSPMPPESARDLRSTMLKAWTDYMDQFMRSPAFLSMMKQSLGTSLEFRKQLNEMLGEMQHAMQGASRQDIDQLAHAIRQLDERVSASFQSFAEQLDELQRRLKKLEKSNSTSPPGRSAAKKRRSTDNKHES